jgi:hypothetical protein
MAAQGRIAFVVEAQHRVSVFGDAIVSRTD